MEKSRWWHAAVGGVCTLLLLLLLASESDSDRLLPGIAAIAAFALSWVLVGRHAWRGGMPPRAFLVLVIAIAFLGTAAFPSFAFVQVIAYPMVWMLPRTIRGALASNVLLCLAVAAGFCVSIGIDSPNLGSNLAVQPISLAFSLVMGFWIAGIETRSHRQRELIDELRASQEQVSRLSREAGVSGERERLAREIHDTVAQDLTGLVMLADRARAEPDPAARDAQLATLAEGARAALAEARVLIAASAPIAVTTGGIADALTRLADRFSRETGMTVTVDASPVGGLERDTEVVLLRCAQEGLANVRKHANAGTARIALAADGDEVHLSVTDDGVGFDPATDGAGFGLPGLRDRLALVGGRLDVESGRGIGTTVTATLPVGVRS